jgi:hypothetical protein
MTEQEFDEALLEIRNGATYNVGDENETTIDTFDELIEYYNKEKEQK